MATAVSTQLHWCPCAEHEAVSVGIGDKCLDQALLQVLSALHITAKTEVDVFRQAGLIPQTNLECRASLENPGSGLCRLESCDNAFEQDPASESVEADSGLSRLGEESMLKGYA